MSSLKRGGGMGNSLQLVCPFDKIADLWHLCQKHIAVSGAACLTPEKEAAVNSTATCLLCDCSYL